jgi:cytoskeletal protein RodZ
VFEIGSSLREARVRQHLEFEQLEERTKVRAKYLRYLEEERFEQLPGHAYTKGFLQVYADALGLDGRLYVEEYNLRYVGGAGSGAEEASAPRVPRAPTGRPRHGRNRRESGTVGVALAAILVVTALVIAAWRYGGAEQRTSFGNQPAATKAPVKLRLTGVRASSMVEIRNTTSRGTPLFAGTIQRGETIERNGRRLWIRIRVPHALRMTVNGKTLALPQRGPFSAVVTKRGLRQAAR